MAAADKHLKFGKWQRGEGAPYDGAAVRAAWEEAQKSLYCELNEFARTESRDGLLEHLHGMAMRNRQPNWGKPTARP